MARMCEPRLGISTQGRIRNLGLSITSGQVLLALLGRPSDEVVARGELPGGGGEAEHGDGPAVAVVNGVAHLGADQGLVSEVVVAGDELVPEPAFPGAVHDGAEVERADLVEGRRARGTAAARCRSEGDGLGPAPLPPGGGSSMRPSRCMASMVTRAIMSLRPPSGLSQPMRRQNSIDRARRLSCAGPATSARRSAISSAVKSRP